jgi:oligopeptide/dipeptide ABC transporter ATP-binding protein
MYAGKKVEEASAEALFARPRHPYTAGLLRSIPRRRGSHRLARRRLNEIEGMVPSLFNLPQGCVFAPRCRHASDRCRAQYPPLEEKQAGHWAACWHSELVERETS